jgi:hypothetical protein
VISLLVLTAAASADLDALDQAVARCDRPTATPVFASETRRRAQFLVDAYREQESIVIDRRQLASDRRAAREGGDNGDFALRQQSLDDRQRALNDSRSLESAREQAMDAMRHYFLLNCGVGRDRLD